MESPSPHLLSFESRRAKEMAALIERVGARATVVPTMREVPLSEHREVTAFVHEVIAGRIDFVLFMTGVGTEFLFDLVERQEQLVDFTGALERATVVVRGPKPAAILHKRGVRVDLKAPEPNTSRELLGIIQERGIAGKTIAIQEYGKPNEELTSELEDLGAHVMSVPVYRWDLPEDTDPMRAAINQAISGTFDAFLFTSAQQIENLRLVATQTSQWDAFRDALKKSVVASVGPTCSEALRAVGLPPDIEAAPPKMGPLVRLVLEHWSVISARKLNSPVAQGE